MPTLPLSSIARRALITTATLNAQAADAGLPAPHHLAADSHSARAAAVVLAARRYAAFWDTGDESYAKLALSPAFVDRTLPDGRPQGPEGPLKASEAFRAAVPDLRAEIDDLVVAGDRASVHLHFRGHFTGQFESLKGEDQPVDFQAFDLYRVKEGRIVENWHLEDNLTLLRQLGAVKP
ncbi:MAG: putative lipoprotein [uncultured Paraburkholderia sp.]|nr:MAG: putative lipoprotein [uncultured Paraburkholderia sp.]CAH2781596.1 MAG: putative lipoprotein [uncultured Paraburkholderia sp.]CAH2914971.1 MAG: putative lipoprotein [uncultured Paraburkholderia sp.]CAH2916507.1 MAG: putative lipoprotein [uncultured Paraburkholderia sp.]